MFLLEKLIIFTILMVITTTAGVNGIPTASQSMDKNNNQQYQQRSSVVEIQPKEYDHIAEDDSDMLMEPNDFRPSIVQSADAAEFYPSPSDDFHPITSTVAEYSVERSLQHHQSVVAPIIDDIPAPAAQSFLPSFFRDVQPLGHSRPYFTHEQQFQPSTHHRFNSNRAIGGGGGGSGGGNANYVGGSSTGAYDQSILGSGDFGVIRGGTFYQENDPPAHGLESNDYYSFYKNNGHGRPQAQPYTAQPKFNNFADDQFSNFRDFADINTPTDPAYSQFVVVYANKNSTDNSRTINHQQDDDTDDASMGSGDGSSDIVGSTSVNKQRGRPKNIFEQLQMLDQQDLLNGKVPSASSSSSSSLLSLSSFDDDDENNQYPLKKNSIQKSQSFKTKLANTKLEKKYKKKFGPKDGADYEPLLALS